MIPQAQRQRSFLAYPIASSPALTAICAQLADGWEAVHPQDRHLTVAFLGQITEQQRSRIWRQTQLQPPPAASVQARSLDRYGHPDSPGTLALSLDARAVAEWMLAHRVTLAALAGTSIDPRPPRPHVSIAHWRGRGRAPPAPPIQVGSLCWLLDSVALYTGAQSAADKQSPMPRYHVQASQRLAAH